MTYTHSMKFILSFPTLPLLVKAYVYEQNILGSSVPDRVNTYTLGLISNAEQNPNATLRVTFKPFESAASTPSLSSFRETEWTWRVNVSDFAAPNAEASGMIIDPHAVSTTYDFA
ncbi:hypothetical protein F4810DRAFT_131875 [Camillea tinctor]|nr:hypothetical protein F4810DRAFT_131875 [Camillea tinctor]